MANVSAPLTAFFTNRLHSTCQKKNGAEPDQGLITQLFCATSACQKEMQPKISKTSSQLIHRGTAFIKAFCASVK
jgi:hypothetical protein